MTAAPDETLPPNARIVLQALETGGFVLLVVPLFEHAALFLEPLKACLQTRRLNPTWQASLGRLSTSSGAILKVVSDAAHQAQPYALRGYTPSVLWMPFGASPEIEKVLRLSVRANGCVLTGFEGSEIHPPQENPSAGGSGQATAVPPAGS